MIRVLDVPWWRRILAMLYDTIAVFTVVYFASFIPVLAAGDAISSGNPLLTFYIVLVVFAYFGVSWTRGRTLGMQAWKIEIVSRAGGRPAWRQAFIRFLGAALALASCGLGYAAALFDREGLAWPDRWSGTQLRRALSAREKP